MALDYYVLSKKKTIDYNSKFDGSEKVKAVDLLSKSINEFESSNPIIINVEKEYIARPDLISLALYSTDKYADLICKVNGISNPFELNENMILICPSLTDINNLLNITAEPNSFINNPEKDSILNIKSNNKLIPNQRRSPAEATIKDNNYTIYEDIKGLVFY